MKNVKKFIEDQIKEISVEVVINKTFEIDVDDIIEKMSAEYGDELMYIDGDMLSEFMETYVETIYSFDEIDESDVESIDFSVEIDDPDMTMREYLKNKRLKK